MSGIERKLWRSAVLVTLVLLAGAQSAQASIVLGNRAAGLQPMGDSAAKSVRMNVLVHYGVKGVTRDQPGNQSFLYGGKDKGMNPSHKVAKIVRSGNNVKLKRHKNEKVVFAGYQYRVPRTQEVIEEEWNGQGILSLTKSVTIEGKQTQVKIADVFAWILLPHHPSAKATLPVHSE